MCDFGHKYLEGQDQLPQSFMWGLVDEAAMRQKLSVIVVTAALNEK